MIYDCFQFFNEIDILLMRMNILDSVVDKFVISEATVTFSGQPKKMYFKEHEEKFAKFSDKIIYQAVTDTPDVNPFERDSFQKCAVKRPLEKICTDEDIIIFSDVDEIPNPVEVKKIIANCLHEKVYHMAQRNFYCYINMEETGGFLPSFSGEFDGVKNKKWLGTKICRYSFLKNISIELLRFPDKKACGIRIDNGGWHFGYMGGDKNWSAAKRAKFKIQSAAHQEFNNEEVLGKLEKRIAKNKEIFGRKTKFKVVPIDDSYPQYLIEHQNEYAHLILPIPKKNFLQRIFQ